MPTLALADVWLPAGAELVVYDGRAAYVGAPEGSGVAAGDNGGQRALAPVLLRANSSTGPVHYLRATGKGMLIELTQSSSSNDGGGGAQGRFAATYHAGDCRGTVRLPYLVGAFTDGSDAAARINNDNDCGWLLAPVAPAGRNITGIVLVLDRLELEATSYTDNRDTYFEVFEHDEAGGRGTRVAYYHGDGYYTEDYLVVPGAQALVTLTGSGRDYDTTGFAARYYALYDGVACPDNDDEQLGADHQ